MKNFINYYYNFNIHDIYLNDGKYFFNVGQNKYMLKQVFDIATIGLVAEVGKQLNYFNPYYFKIILNKEGNNVTVIDGKAYVVLLISNIRNEKISIFDIKLNNYVVVSSKLMPLNRFNWGRLWENKIDYFEELIFSKRDTFKKLFPLFNYFTGIAENALLYYKTIIRETEKEDIDRLVLSHDRISCDFNLYDYYDITNIIIDHPSRDVSEYIKSLFLNREWDVELFKEYLRRNDFSKFGIGVLFARTMFPSFFFDYVEKMLTENTKIDLLYLEVRANEFKLFLSELNILLSSNYGIPTIPWLIKKM